jgi:hypothetical protein
MTKERQRWRLLPLTQGKLNIDFYCLPQKILSIHYFFKRRTNLMHSMIDEVLSFCTFVISMLTFIVMLDDWNNKKK